MTLIVLDAREDGVVVSQDEFCEALTRLDLYQGKFEDFLRVAITAYAAAARSPQGVAAFRPIERWIHNNYLELRDHLPPDLKRLYLHEIAFPAK